MRVSKTSWFVAMIATLVGSGVAVAQRAPREKVSPAFSAAIINVPGKKLIAVIVEYPPGGKTPSHRHARSAFVTGYVLSGEIRSQVDDGPATHITSSAKTRARRNRPSCSRSSSSIRPTRT
jgi:quercetin dioxygenase-like cupin family protein